MQGGKRLAHTKVIGLVLLLFCSIYSLSVNKTVNFSETENNLTQFSDNNSNNHQWNISSGQWYSIEVICDTCTGELKLDETILFEAARMFTGQVNVSGNLKLILDNTNDEEIEVISLIAPNETYPTIRPAPGEFHPPAEVYECLNSDSCIDIQSSILATYLGSGNLNEEFYILSLIHI